MLTTSPSYTVSAWVKLTNTANYATAVAQYGGQHNSAFRLHYSPANGGKWVFGVSEALHRSTRNGYDHVKVPV